MLEKNLDVYIKSRIGCMTYSSQRIHNKEDFLAEGYVMV